MAGRTAAVVTALALLCAAPAPAAPRAPDGAVPAAPSDLNVPQRPDAGIPFAGEGDLAELILLALGAVVVLVVIPAQLARGVAARRADALGRSARADRPNGS